MSNKEIIRELWRFFSSQKWEEAKNLLSDDFEAFWPQTKEKFVGKENFIGMNQEYPGKHVGEIEHLIEEGDTISCTVYISADTGQRAIGTSYFTIQNQKIVKAIEYWGDYYDAPESRAKWR